MGALPRTPEGLTLKQAKFTQAVIKQIAETGKVNLTQAAKDSLEVTTDKSASVGAATLLDNARVKQTIQEALIGVGLTAPELAKEIKVLAAAPVDKVSADTKLRSIVEILKLTGAYPTTKHANLNLSIKANLSNLQYGELEKEVEAIDEELKQLTEAK